MSLTAYRPSNAPLFDSAALPAPPDGTVWMEWVGEPSPLDDPVVGYNLITNRYTDHQKRVIRQMCRHRVARCHRHTRLIRSGSGPEEIRALTKTYRFGNMENAQPGHPKSFCQAVTFNDAYLIKQSDVGHQFYIHNETDAAQGQLVSLPSALDGTVSLVNPETFDDPGVFHRAMRW